MPLYFAYGSNMHRADMAARCPGAIALSPAVLKGWRYFIMREGYASIRREIGAYVRGVVWRIDAQHQAALDEYEDLASGLYRRELLTVRTRGVKHRALVYIGASVEEGDALPRYQQRVDSAAEEWRLPALYRRELRRWRS